MQEWKAQNEQIESIEKLHVHYRHLFNYRLSYYKWVGGWEHISYVNLLAVTRRPRMELNLLFNRKAHNNITCYTQMRTFNEVTNIDIYR